MPSAPRGGPHAVHEHLLVPSRRPQPRAGSVQEDGRRPRRRRQDAGPRHAVRGHHGYVLAETTDPVALGKWMQEWTDLLQFQIEPVNGDEDVMNVLGA
jgi:uncharacterized protein DUF3303